MCKTPGYSISRLSFDIKTANSAPRKLHPRQVRHFAEVLAKNFMPAKNSGCPIVESAILATDRRLPPI